MTAIQRHEPEDGILSNAVEAGGLVFLAGSVADDLDLDIAGQTRQALAYIDTMLARCGTSKSRLVSATVWLADMTEAPAYNAVWKEWVDPEQPAGPRDRRGQALQSRNAGSRSCAWRQSKVKRPPRQRLLTLFRNAC